MSRFGVIEHQAWPSLWPWFLIDRYDRDGGHYNPRYRIEFVAPFEVMRIARSVELPCCACRRPMLPFRRRRSDSLRGGAIGRLYFNVACPWGAESAYGTADLSCSRTRAARDEYERIINAVKALGGGRGADPRQLLLF